MHALIFYIVFGMLEVFDYYETNAYLKFVWMVPTLQGLYQWWMHSMENTFEDYSAAM